MNQQEKSLQTKRKVKQGRKKTGTILQSPNLRSKVLFCIFSYLNITHFKYSQVNKLNSNRNLDLVFHPAFEIGIMLGKLLFYSSKGILTDLLFRSTKLFIVFV